MSKIAFVSCYPPMQGRLAEYGYNLIQEIQKCSKINRIDVIAETTNDHVVETVNEKVRVHRTWKSDNPISILSVLLKIQTLKPDIVHFNLHMAVFGRSRIANFVGLSLPFLCRLMGFTSVTTLHNIIEKIDMEKTGFKDTFLNRLSAFAVTRLLVLSTRVTVNVKSHADLLKERYKCQNTKIIPHGTWKNSVNQNNVTPKTESILYIGHTGPYKDMDLLFETFEILRKKKLGLKLVIAGRSHPNYPDFLERYKTRESDDEVIFSRYIPEEQLQAVFEKASVVILPYFTCTGTSGVAHLASSFGTPIIATDLPEFRELAEEGCGLLLSRHNPQALASRIEEIVLNPKLALELKERNFIFAKSRSWDIVASRFCQLYDELMEAKELRSF